MIAAHRSDGQSFCRRKRRNPGTIGGTELLRCHCKEVEGTTQPNGAKLKTWKIEKVRPHSRQPTLFLAPRLHEVETLAADIWRTACAGRWRVCCWRCGR